MPSLLEFAQRTALSDDPSLQADLEIGFTMNPDFIAERFAALARLVVEAAEIMPEAISRIDAAWGERAAAPLEAWLRKVEES